MACDDIELIQYLAFWDFSQLTHIDKVRAHQVFLVSCPGGHPRPWNALRNECSRLIENFLNTLSDVNSKLALRWEAAFSLKDLTESTKMDILRKVDSKKSLGNILCVAYTEDRLGVVQIDLPNVLGLFCDSYLQLEKFGRLSTTQCIETSKRRLIDTSRVMLKTELIKSLQCIKSTYGENLWNTKSAFTRLYNKTSIRLPFSNVNDVMTARKGKKATKLPVEVRDNDPTEESDQIDTAETDDFIADY
uniref:Uncharacterized protein n=1 Tax=Romanomermis culicivorax TaxID=13658 RepID=A0A915L9S0_ROMCU